MSVLRDEGLPLAGLRIAVTLPPHAWFGGVDYNFAIEMSEELRALGAKVFDVDVAGFTGQNESYIAGVIEALKSFRPDVVISLPNALYVLLCVTRDQQNIFRDILCVPTLMLWDHGLLQLPRQILNHNPGTPEDARTGAVSRIRQVLNHPLYLHYSPDKGHIAALDKAGILEAGKVRFFLQPAYPNFVKYGYRTVPRNMFRSTVAFAGNVYLKAAHALPFRNQPLLGSLESRVMEAKKARLTECAWDLLVAEIQALDSKTRKQLSLEPDSTFFWNFMHEEIELVANTEVRLAVLTGLKREYDFYGNFMEPGSVASLSKQYGIRFLKSLDYFTELPLLFINSSVIVDVVNLGYNTGVSPKIMGCFAAGGLVLFDYKEDFARIMGDAAGEVMYRGIDHLNSLVDAYLAKPHRRRDIASYLQHRVVTEFSFSALAKRLLVDERAW
uniref:Spore protein YkvP/CgeB glycosyl transferase-like domain-containing protein n=1 Tax=Solibacter usitatus (strain Ellin6076) TaxID=234267 RepID=Q02BK1_SOLUE